MHVSCQASQALSMPAIHPPFSTSRTQDSVAQDDLRHCSITGSNSKQKLQPALPPPSKGSAKLKFQQFHPDEGCSLKPTVGKFPMMGTECKHQRLFDLTVTGSKKHDAITNSIITVMIRLSTQVCMYSPCMTPGMPAIKITATLRSYPPL